MFQPYRPEPYSDFAEPAARAAYELALAGVRGRFGAEYGLVIAGETVVTGDWIDSVNPARPAEVVGRVASGGAAEAEAALEAAWAAFAVWSALDALERSRLGMKLAAIMRRNKFELAAIETFEAGKNWAEAEADVAEAIDFVDYYARQALEMAEPIPVMSVPGEENESHLVPIGAGVVIPPWNFPGAILVGMAMGPVLAGNTVVVKPASNTPVLGARWMEMLDEAGFPPGVVNYVPGPGGEIGDLLVDHPRTRFINFTGSKDVGLRIAERSARVHPGQRWLKRAFMEMGGKDAMIVDETADLAAAAADAVRSAFGFQGQKCSAASRLILVESVHDEVLERVIAGVAALEMGPPEENKAVGPVISAAQHRSVLAEIASGRDEARLLAGGEAVDMDGGWYLQPTVFAGVDPKARLAQHEIFGPVLSVISARDFDHALEIANGTEFGLTGGLYSRRRDRIDRARREFRVGNLYINRKITGALVGVQPFGGFDMSGSNSKAGGPDYLRLFMEMKTVSERWVSS
ncbi:MAG: L-glutamate gamma-semialdehyde dehydrogenase [Acidimicrobiia bacterium]|nr:MAG: L-glutamate gamma-semialdehyde dehydrogenase [Acidimicrobiia bacterium]